MITIRTATIDDSQALARIYGHHCLHGFGTFEEVEPSPEDMSRRLQTVRDHGLPYLVADSAQGVLGFAYAGVFRPRAAYRFTVEDSIYLHPDHTGKGLGKLLLNQVIADCEQMGLRQMMAVIGDSANAGSINLHRSLGFEHKGIGSDLGFKHGRWVDIVWMQRSLNEGSQTLPTFKGLSL
jgi:L-amino acid N-acyltransferase YncA